jgi:hypothetical protein
MAAYIADSSDNILVQVLTVLTSGLGILLVVFGLLAVLHVIPKISFNEAGIRDHILLKKPILWSEIDHIELAYESNRNKLLVVLKNEFDYSKTSFMYKKSRAKNKKQAPNEFMIDLSLCEVNYKELLDFLKEKQVYSIG